ncbi:NUDIX domain-containing protein [Halorarius halobius]|uniref:NUDIX domain-containing protein n=1 Tax=Halorarius halobius TaxID=2962671 RepID=UPI0020CC4665|nr:NUDIX domain-containing protein [Halorarius halobius]
METVHVVTAFLRNRGEVLLLRRSGEVGSYSGQWGGVAGHAEGSPDELVREEIREETGLHGKVTLVRAGESFDVEDAERGTRWVVHPYLFDCESRDVTPNEETTEWAWVPPTAIRERETVPALWTSYDRVRPRLGDVTDDATHGSAYVSLRALDVLRDEAALADDYEAVAAVARDLLAARPSMHAVTNRVNRAMRAADERTPAAVERAAIDAIDRAARADERAAATAADHVEGRVVTLSRSGTVTATLRRADPPAVTVLESRPAREGVGVAEELADETDVTLAVDAAVAGLLDAADCVLVGADAVLPDGSVVNKVGTRTAATAAVRAGVPVWVVCARDKVAPTGTTDPDLEPGDPEAVYDGDADLRVHNPTFDRTPAALVDGVVTEAGVLDAEDVASVADDHAALADWDS